jgi:hypothetical protein
MNQQVRRKVPHGSPIFPDRLIDPNEEVAAQKAPQKYPTAIMLRRRLNETGTCGRI